MSMPDRSSRGQEAPRRHPYAGDRSRDDGAGGWHRRDGEEQYNALPSTRDGGQRGQHSPPAGVGALEAAANFGTAGSVALQLLGDPAAGLPPASFVPAIEVPPDGSVRALTYEVLSAVRNRQTVPVLLSAGNRAIYQSVLAIAAATLEVANEQAASGSDTLDLTFQPALRTIDRVAPLIACFVHPRASTRTQSQDTTELTVASTSVPNKVAGAIAGRVREGKSVRMMSIGADATAAAVLAIAGARLFLETRDCLDLQVRAACETVEKAATAFTAVRFTLITCDIP